MNNSDVLLQSHRIQTLKLLIFFKHQMTKSSFELFQELNIDNGKRILAFSSDLNDNS